MRKNEETECFSSRVEISSLEIVPVYSFLSWEYGPEYPIQGLDQWASRTSLTAASGHFNRACSYQYICLAAQVCTRAAPEQEMSGPKR